MCFVALASLVCLRCRAATLLADSYWSPYTLRLMHVYRPARVANSYAEVAKRFQSLLLSGWDASVGVDTGHLWLHIGQPWLHKLNTGFFSTSLTLQGETVVSFVKRQRATEMHNN